MQAGERDGAALFALFADEAVYIEPFSGAGQLETHRGREAIEACLRAGWKNAPPDMTLEVNRIDVDGNVVRTEWTCASPVFEAPMRGVDVCTVVDGRIQRLEVRFA